MDLFLDNLFELALLSAPWLVLGLVVAGLIRAWLPVDLVGKSLGGTGVGSVTRSALNRCPAATLLLWYPAGGIFPAPFRGLQRIDSLFPYRHS